MATGVDTAAIIIIVFLCIFIFFVLMGKYARGKTA
jgi:hypothetical protein